MCHAIYANDFKGGYEKVLKKILGRNPAKKQGRVGLSTTIFFGKKYSAKKRFPLQSLTPV